jgi:hypothetical protein
LPVFWGQRLQPLLKGLQTLLLPEPFLGIGPGIANPVQPWLLAGVRWPDNRTEQLGPDAAQAHQGSVDDNAGEPGGKLGMTFEAPQIAKGRQQRVNQAEERKNSGFRQRK